MAFRAPHQPLYAVEEYREFATASEMRHAFRDGQIVVMPGANEMTLDESYSGADPAAHPPRAGAAP